MFKQMSFHFKVALLYLKEARYAYFLMSLLFISSIILWGLIFLIYSNFEKIIEDKKSEYEIIVYLKQGAKKENFENTIKEFPYISQFIYEDSKKVSENLKKKDNKLAETINSLNFNPYPSLYRITLKKENFSKDTVKDLVDFLAKKAEIAGVEEVNFGEDWIDFLSVSFKNINTITIFISYILITTGFILMIGAVINCRKYLNSNIERFRLLGASKSFIQIPFIIAGIFIGILSSGFAFLILFSGYSYLLTKDIFLYFFSWEQILIVLVLGITIPLIGNLLSIK